MYSHALISFWQMRFYAVHSKKKEALFRYVPMVVKNAYLGRHVCPSVAISFCLRISARLSFNYFREI